MEHGRETWERLASRLDANMKTLYARDSEEWRGWLQKNHLAEQGVWLVFYRKETAEPSLSYDDATDGALCFGWIDSTIKKIDDRKYARKFTPRRPGSIWSKLNIYRVDKLTREGKMTKYGLALFRDRTWQISLAQKFKAKEPPFPHEFMKALKENSQAWENFQSFAPGYKRRYLMWITSAKTDATRARRIEEAVNLIARNLKSLLK